MRRTGGTDSWCAGYRLTGKYSIPGLRPKSISVGEMALTCQNPEGWACMHSGRCSEDDRASIGKPFAGLTSRWLGSRQSKTGCVDGWSTLFESDSSR